jgi:hypothetical protein
VTGAATLVGELSATLNGTVNPNGGSTQAYFEYGTTTSYGNTSPSQDVGSGTSDVPVSQYVSGLACATTYHFRAVGVNASGTTPGGDLTFMTTACKPSRVFVSVLGLDTNDCSNIATPCRTLNAAITQVAEDGEVIVVKSGSYAGATITKGVKIDAASGVVAFSGQPVTVNAPSAKVVIRGLTLKAVTPGTGDGILIQDAGAVFVENTVIDGWDTAIYGQATELFIKDSTIRNNGIGIWPFSGKITIDTSRFTNNSTGIRASMATGIATLALRGSTLSGNFLGIDNDSPSVITVEKCQIANNHVGMSLQPGSMGVLRLSHSAVTGNDFGLVNAGGTLYVYGNNAVRGNTIDTSGTITPAGLQ